MSPLARSLITCPIGTERDRLRAVFLFIAIPVAGVYLWAMPCKPVKIPPAAAKAFVRDRRAFFAEPNATKRDAIAARQLHALREHLGPRDKKLRITDVHELFQAMKDHA